MTVLGDHGNMKDFLVASSDINWYKGKLFSLETPVVRKLAEAALNCMQQFSSGSLEMVFLQQEHPVSNQSPDCLPVGRIWSVAASF